LRRRRRRNLRRRRRRKDEQSSRNDFEGEQKEFNRITIAAGCSVAQKRKVTSRCSRDVDCYSSESQKKSQAKEEAMDRV
jgi:hypothetical protein